MDLDPRLRPEYGRQGSRSIAAAGDPSSTPSPSTQGEAGAIASSKHDTHLGAGSSDRPSMSQSTPHGNHQHGLSQQRQQSQGDGSGGDDDDDGDHAGQGPNADDAIAGAAPGAGDGDPKKSRACEACRGLKVRCEPDPHDEDAPCKRCKKAGRNCVVTVPTRKRQKKTDSRVSELEKKIDALTASLQARATGPLGVGGGYGHGHGQSHGGHGNGSPSIPGIAGIAAASGPPHRQSTEGLGPLWATEGKKSWEHSESSGARHVRGVMSPSQGQPSRGPPHRSSTFGAAEGSLGYKRKASEMRDRDDTASMSPGPHPSSWPSQAGGTRSDIIDRGIISTEMAADLFIRYKEHMLRHLPAVVFPPSQSVMEIRRSKPYLFLAIMAAASSQTHSLQKVLQRELMELFAEKIVIVGEKNLELIQALHVAVIWYWPPEHFEELKFYQLVHMAAVMALDLGLGKKSGPKRGMSGLSWREHPFRRQPQPEPTSIECRRTWLTCHYLAANTAMSLHRPNLIRWTPFMTESMEILQTSPDASPTDKYLCHLVWQHRMAEDVGLQLSMDDPDAVVNILDARTQYTLRGLERDLDKYMAAVPKELMQPSLKIGFSILSLYMHELALHSDSSTDQVRPPFSTDILQDGIVPSEPLSAAHINALSACLTAIDNIFQTFLSMDVFSIRCLPVFTFVRVAYAVVILMKMYFSASSPSSELGKVINKDNMRVAYYLEALLEKFGATAAEDKCRPASKFLLVLVMLRTWFMKHGKGEASEVAPNANATGPAAQQRGTGAGTSTGVVGQSTSTTGTPAPATSASEEGQSLPAPPFMHQQRDQEVNTPLQVLSEVAMGRESNTPRPFYNHISGGQAPPSQPQPYYTDMGPNEAAPTPSSWLTQQQQQPSTSSTSMADFDPTTIGLPGGLDFESLGGFDLQDLSAGGGAQMVLNDPLFSDMFQGLPDPNFFSM